MRRLQKRALSTLTALALVLGLFTPLGGLAPQAKAYFPGDVGSGSCGENVTYTYNHGHVTIKGTGNMENYSYRGGSYGIWTTAPWSGKTLRSITIEEGVTSLGSWCYYYRDDTGYLVVPKSVTWIGANNDGVRTVYYAGSEEEWNQITLKDPDDFSKAEFHFHSTGPDDDGTEDTGDTETEEAPIVTPILEGVSSTRAGVQIEWTRPLDTLDTTYAVEGYYVLRKTEGESYQKIAERGEALTYYVDDTVEEGKTYTYTVQAYAQGKTGAFNEEGLTITYTKPPEEEKTWAPSAASNTYVQEHIWFAESELYDDRMDHRFASSIAKAQNSGAQVAAEIAYDILNSVDEFTKFKRLTVAENPYDLLLAELLANMGDVDDAKVAIDSEMFDLSNSVLELIYKVQPDYKPSDTFKTDLMALFEEPESFQKSHPDLYQTLKTALTDMVGKAGREGTLKALLKGVEGVEGFASALAVVVDAAEVMDWFVDSVQYYLLVQTYVNLGEDTREILRSIGTKMSNDTHGGQFQAALAKYEKYMTADNLAKVFMMGGDIASDLGGRLYDMVGSRAASFLATSYLQEMTGASIAVPLAAYHLGWALSDAITGNDKLVLSRMMIRANYYMEEALYSILQDKRATLLRDESPEAALEFHAAYSLLRQCELYTLREYRDYLDVSQKSAAQGILHFGNIRTNAYEIAIADREIIDWDLALCHGESVSDQHLGGNTLTINGASQVTLLNGTGKTLLEIEDSGVTEHGSSDVTGQILGGGVFYMGVYKNGLYNLRITPKEDQKVVVIYAQHNADMEQVKIEDYVVPGQGYISGSLNAEVYGNGDGVLRLTNQKGENIAPVKSIDNMDRFTAVKGIEPGDGAQSTMTKGWSMQLEPEVEPSNATLPYLCWSSSDPSVATVNGDGLVTAVAPGTVSIVAQALDGSGTRLVYELTVSGDLPEFTDVSSNDWYCDAVQWAVENGVTTGTTDTTFSPDRPCSRAEVVTLLWRAMHLGEGDGSGQNPFRDVKDTDYFHDAVLWAAENEITTGTSANTFSPGATCTRAQVVTFLWRTDTPLKKNTGPVGFRDVRVGDYFWFPVKWALDNDITTGTGADTFSPNLSCTRAQVVTFLYRYLYR